MTHNHFFLWCVPSLLEFRFNFKKVVVFDNSTGRWQKPKVIFLKALW